MEPLKKALEELKAKLLEIQDSQGKGSDTYKALSEKVETLESEIAELKSKGFKGPGFSGVAVPGAEDGFQLCRALWAIKSGDWSKAGYEYEVMAATAEKNGVDVARIKAASLQNDATLGNLVPTNVMNEMIPLLRSRLILGEIGVRMLSGMSGSPVEMNRESAEGTGYWVGENATITASDQSTERISLRPHKAAALTQISNTLLRAGGVGVEAFVRQSLVNTLARVIQVAFFEGTGSTAQPLGISNQLGVQAKTSIGTPTVVDLQQMMDALRRANVDMGVPSVRWVMHPAGLAALEQIAASDTTQRMGAPILSRGDPTQGIAPRILGLPYATTTDITSTDIYLARWDSTLLADWGPMEVALTSEAGTAFQSDQTWIRVIQEVDVNVTQPTAVVHGSGLTVPSAP